MAIQGSSSLRDDDIEVAVAEAYAHGWWMFLVAGILWLLLGFVILSLRPASISVTVILIALAFWLGGFTMFAFGFVTTGGLRVTAIILGLLGLAAGVAALVWPEPTLVVLGVLVAWYLLIRGVFDVVISLMHRHVHGWWLGLLAGVVEIALGAWAVGNPDRSVLLMVSIVGIWAIIKGVLDLIAAFHYRSLDRALS